MAPLFLEFLTHHSLFQRGQVINEQLEARAVAILADIEAQMMDYLHLVRRPDIEADDDEET